MPLHSGNGVLKLKLSKKQLEYWFGAALVLVAAGVAFASAGIDLDSPAGLVFRAVFGLVAAIVVIGFYLSMFAEAVHSEVGVRKAASVTLFIAFPIGSAFLYYWWTRHVRNRSAS